MNWRDVPSVTCLVSLCLPLGLFAWQVATRRLEGESYVLYFAIGMLLSQLFHSLIFFRQEWQTLRALPDWGISARTAVTLSLALFSVTYAGMVLVRPGYARSLGTFLIVAAVVMLLSQVFGRGLIKLGFELALVLVVFLALLLRQSYAFLPTLRDGLDRVRFIYDEHWEILKISVPVTLFYLGTVGVTFAVQFLREQYFKGGGAMTQFQMFRYGVMLVYSAIGVAVLIYAPLVRGILTLRRLLLG